MATQVRTSEFCVLTHAALHHMFIMQLLACQLPFLASRKLELAVPPLMWAVNCIKIGGHVVLMSGPLFICCKFDITIFKIQQTCLTDVFHFCTRLTDFCFLKPHSSTRTPTKDCKWPSTNLNFKGSNGQFAC